MPSDETASDRSDLSRSPSDDASSDSDRQLRRKKITLRKREDAPDPRFTIDYEQELNPAQHAAVQQLDGPILCVAGAGTGKTRTLIYRVARMIESGIRPENILLLTFTRKAASEMIRRATMLVGSRAEDVQGGTFHSFANITLRKYANYLDYQSNFTILDQGDAADVINLLRGRMGLDTKTRRFPRKQTIGAMISASVNRITPLREIVEEDYPHFKDDIPELEKLARTYRDYKQTHSLMDYDDLLLNLVMLLERHPDLRRKLGGVHRYIMVDEYQDTNRLQHEIVRMLGERHKNVMAVGDESQSIYSFRGADFRNIMDFPTMFEDTHIVLLEENYRSTQPVLDFANEILRRAKERYEKELYTRKTGGRKPMIVTAATDQLQSELIVQMVLELREEGKELNDIAVLFRSSFLSFDLEIELNKANIPYVKMGGFRFIETAHVKDVLSYLRILSNPNDVVSWNRALLLLEGVGPRTSQKVVDGISQGQLRLDTASRDSAPGNENVADLFRVLASLRNERLSPGAQVERLLKYYRPIMKSKYDDFNKREKDLEIFVDIASRYRSLNSLLTDMALEPPNESVVGVEPGDEDDEKLILSTIHSAKGLEWNTVFVLTALEGRFPSMRAGEDPEEIEEERRLMYVACTRAKERLLISYPLDLYDRESGMTLTMPSRFIADIPDDIADRFVVDEEG